jgi:hypothetical protein
MSLVFSADIEKISGRHGLPAPAILSPFKESSMAGFRFRTHLVPALLLAVWSFARLAFAQEAPVDIEALKKTAPKVYIDCGSCDLDYIKTEITFVNYVRDRKEAQVHVLITTQSTGSGGREYTLGFIGQNEFKGADDTQKFFSNKTDTDDEIRQGLVKALKIGLMGYVARTPIRSRIGVSYAQEEKPRPLEDRWNFWVFSLNGEGFFNGEQSYRERSLEADFSANRITPDLKIRMSLSADQSNDHFEYEDEVIDSTSEKYEFDGLLVKSLSEHWSVGGYLKAYSSTYDNHRFILKPAPAVEYNFFPYAESTRRQLRVLYTLGFNIIRYREVTIYDKTSQNLWQESLAVTLDVKEKWGSISTTLGGSHYFYDFSQYQLNLFANISLQLVKGFNVFFFGGGDRIHDQIFLPKGGASLEEVLLRRRQLATGYEYFFGVGLSYTFGSIFTNVVNPRFGSRGGSGISINID